MRKSTRRLVTIVTLFALMLFQGSVAVHACALADVAPGTAHHATTAGDNIAMGHCTGMADKSAAALCLKHCNQGEDLNGSAAVADVPAVTDGAFLVVAPVATHVGSASVATHSLAISGAAPPPLLLSQRLRI
jgi:hypothetical protein